MATTEKKFGVILSYMGGPERAEEVRPFLANLFNDRHILDIPQPIRFMVSRLIAFSRAKAAKAHYDEIGGGSPLKKLTADQAEKLQAKLEARGFECQVRTGYSYVYPFINDALKAFKGNPPKLLIAIPLYPQDSITTYGSIRDDFNKSAMKLGLNDRLRIVPPYFDHDLHITAAVKLLEEALDKIDRNESYRVVFTAHSLPQSVIDKGDPYRDQVETTVARMLEKVAIDDYVLSFQSKIGPVKWMQPSTVDTVIKAGKDGIKQLVVVPVGFTCDHVETLHELDIELKEIAEENGITEFIRADVFNSHPLFIELLADLVIREIHG